MNKRLPILLLLALSSALHAEDAWWNKAWTQRQAITIDGAAAGIPEATGPSALLIRLHDGNFQFANAAENGTDLRFVAADGKTLLPHQIEKWDSLLNEAFVWVKVPEVKPDSKASIYVYYGGGDSTVPAPDKTKTYDEESSLVYHFSEATPTDSTANANNATVAGTLSEGSLIGRGLRLPAPAPISIPGSPSLGWTQGQDFSADLWIKPASLQPNAVVLSRDSFKLVLDQGVPFVEIGGQRSNAGAPVTAGTWSHLAVISKGGAIQLLLNGKSFSQLAAVLPASSAPINIGHAEGSEALIGEIDELRISKAARSASYIQLSATTQGTTDAVARAISLGQVEGGETASHSAAFEHVMLFGDIAKNMMFDGWIAIGVCVIMIAVGWTVAIRKFNYLNSIEKGTREFLRQWKLLSSDLTAIDHTDDKSVRSLGGNVDESAQSLVSQSPLYEIYHLGSEEIRHRLARDKDRTKGLSGRSIQAIRAALDAGLVHAQHKLTNGLVYLTISIAGGPYVGLLGTVVGVMITFAIIAKSGEVDVNSIAPGIASALLATVAGLVVAIPALFIYSYLNNRIKNTLAQIQVFIDEFVAKMAEFYPPEGEASPYSKPRSTDH